MTECEHPAVIVTPGIDYLTGLDMPGPERMICIICGEEVEE